MRIAALISLMIVSVSMEATAQTRFPIREEKHTRISRGHHMRTEVRLSENGRLDVRTNIYSKDLTGFHGGVVVYILDSTDPKAANVLFNTKPARYGVDGNIPGAGSDRTESFFENVPPQILFKAKGLYIEQMNQPNPIFSREEGKEFFKKIAEKTIEIFGIG